MNNTQIQAYKSTLIQDAESRLQEIRIAKVAFKLEVQDQLKCLNQIDADAILSSHHLDNLVADLFSLESQMLQTQIDNAPDEAVASYADHRAERDSE